MTERELHLTERPGNFKTVVGQPEAVAQLIAMGKAGAIPHCLLFTGPSGCGKTTLARIIRMKLKCGDHDFAELNCAQTRGIDMVRAIQQRVGLAPIAGRCRVWLIDECHQLTADAQGAFLKLLEEPPNHVYFMLATTNPEKLKKTIRTRCTEIKVRELTKPEIAGMVKAVCDRRKMLPEKAWVKVLAEVADGSARKALVLLQQVMNIDGTDEKIAVLQKSDTKQAAIMIGRALLNTKTTWGTMAKIIKGVEGEPESLRWMVLAYMTSVALGGGNNSARAVEIIEEFSGNFYDTKKAGLVAACYNMVNH